MTKVDDPMPEVALEAIERNRTPESPTRRTDRKSGIDWLRERIERAGYHYSIKPDCGSHFHLECTNCGSVKCGGRNVDRYERIEQRCDCGGLSGSLTDHLVVPFDNFGRHYGFPDRE